MTDQLVLIDSVPTTRTSGEQAFAGAAAASAADWQLDATTCEIGRRGVARARQALQQARTQALTATVGHPDLPAAA